MNYLQMAKDSIEQSLGDIRWEGQKEHLTQLATVYVAIAQAEAAQRQADALEKIALVIVQVWSDEDNALRVCTLQ